MNYGPGDYRAIVDATSIYSDLQEASGFDGIIIFKIPLICIGPAMQALF